MAEKFEFPDEIAAKADEKELEVEIEVVDERGNVMEFRFDAKTGETLREKIE